MKKELLLAGITLTTVLGLTGCGAKELVLVSEQIDAELGSELDTTATKYVNLDDTAAADASVDFSAVDMLTVGIYPAVVTCGEQTAEFEVNVVDTTAPVVEVVDDLTVKAGVPIYAKDVITDITELSGNTEVEFTVATSQQEETAEAAEQAETETENVEETEQEEEAELPALEETFTVNGVTCQNAAISFDENGVYDISVVVLDASGNRTVVPLHVLVGDVPVFSGIEDLTVALGTDAEKVNYLDGVTATDCNGNDLTEDIVCDFSAVNLGAVGEYELTYTVIDENGLKAEQTATVTVEEKSGKTETVKKNTSGKTETKSDTKKNESTTGDSAGSNNSGTSADVNASSGNTNSGTNTPSADAGNSNTSNADAGNAGNNNNSGADAGNTSAPSTDTGSTSTPSTPMPETPSTPDAGSASNDNQQMADEVLSLPNDFEGIDGGTGEDWSQGDGTSVWN